ncbi:MAG: calcium/sodium antiporter [Deltaproteobacteria bacterium]|nr:calcium/sodium antiporter [Deltaproteobacteria bacterium]
MNWITMGLFVFGLAVLMGGAEILVRGASKMARIWGMPPLLIGLTVVAFGTSAPEMAISVNSALSHQSEISLGNVVGSNVFNILVILGVSALIIPLVVNQQLVRWDVPIMIGVSVLVYILGYDHVIDRVEGIVLFGGLILYIWFTIRSSPKESPEVREEYVREFGGNSGNRIRLAGSAGLVIGGLVLLVAGADLMVDNAVIIATALGLSKMVIGLTIVAIGTSLPEVATSIMAALKGQRDIAVGNAVGSNLFNMMGVLGLAAMVSSNGVAVSQGALNFDIPVMIAVAMVSLPILFSGHLISRVEGAIFVIYYAAYLSFVLQSAALHDYLESFNGFMLYTVFPITGFIILYSLISPLWGKKAEKTRN